MVIYTNHLRLKHLFEEKHAICWKGSGILSSEWIKTLVAQNLFLEEGELFAVHPCLFLFGLWSFILY